jgi:predicted transcriptional regulator
MLSDMKRDTPPTLTIRLQPELRIALEIAAKRADRTVSYLVRRLIAEWCEKQQEKRA